MNLTFLSLFPAMIYDKANKPIGAVRAYGFYLELRSLNNDRYQRFYCARALQHNNTTLKSEQARYQLINHAALIDNCVRNLSKVSGFITLSSTFRPCVTFEVTVIAPSVIRAIRSPESPLCRLPALSEC